MSLQRQTDKPKGSWHDQWADAVGIKFKRPQYEKMVEIKAAMGCTTWANLADELYRLKELLAKRRRVYKV